MQQDDEQRFAELVVRESVDGATVHDLDGTYRFVSSAFAEMTGHDADALVGRSPYELFHPDDVDSLQRVHENSIRDCSPFRISYRFRHPDGTYVWLESVGRVARDGLDGQPLLVVTSRKVAGRPDLLETVEFQRRLLSYERDIAQQQRAFMQTVAHRLRTPVTTVLGFVTVLTRKYPASLPDTVVDMLERIESGAQHLAEIVETVTDSERLSRRAALLDVEPVKLHDLARRVSERYAAKDAPMEVAVDPHVLIADGRRLEQALGAMVANAIEHTPVGTAVRISTQVVEEGTVLSVEDDGPGFPEDVKRQAFEPFQRGPGRDHDPGMGLGLHIVEAIASAHGGRAWIEDRPGGGSRVNLLIPRARQADEDASNIVLDDESVDVTI